MTARRGARKSVLVVDDDAAIHVLLADILPEEGYDVVSAYDGEQALARVAAQPPNVILLDLLMPGLDGWELVRRLRADPVTAPIPVVLLSAAPTLAAARAELGIRCALAKPFDLAELVNALNRCSR